MMNTLIHKHAENKVNSDVDLISNKSECNYSRNRDIGNKARFYVLKRERGDEDINPYNPHILRAWGTNMDLQLVGSIYGAAQYFCHYMCNDEPKELRQPISRNLEKLPGFYSEISFVEDR